MKCGKILGLACGIYLCLLVLTPVSAQAQRVRVNKLTDVAFGTIANFTSDQTISRSICVFTTPLGTRYGVTASGSGSSGAFTLASGGNTMPYEVQWAASTGQTVGTALTANVRLGAQATTATTSGCTTAPATTASLIIILRTDAVSAARSGNYTGTLSLLLSPN